MIIPVLARTPEGAKRLLSMIEGYGAAAAELAVPLKTCAMAYLDAQWTGRRADQCCMLWTCHCSLLPALIIRRTQARHATRMCFAELYGKLLGCRLANAQAAEVKKLGVRGTLANGVAKVEAVKAAHPPAVWFVFSGAHDLVVASITFPSSLLHPRNIACSLDLQHANGRSELSRHAHTCAARV